MCNQAVDINIDASEYVAQCFKTQEMWDKPVDVDPSVIQFVSELSKLKKCVIKLLILLILVFDSIPDRFKTQKMCDKTVDDFLPTWKFVPDWLVTSKMIKKLYNTVFADDDILFFVEDSGNVSFLSDEMGILSVNLDNINLYDGNFYEDDPETIIYVRLFAEHYRYKKRKGFTKEISKKLMIVAWHPTRWLDWYMPVDEKKEVELVFSDEN